MSNSSRSSTEERALSTLIAHGTDPSFARSMLDALRAAGLSIADERRNELVCRWVDVQERPVPPEADTIIRTITRTVNQESKSWTHWLDGLKNPRLPA
jgi:hypothetical protein